MRRVALVAAPIVALVGLVLACVSATPELSSFPPRSGAVWSSKCCGEPIEHPAPEYPKEAMRSGQDGWVIVSGILDRRGWVTDPIVLVAEPEGVFDEAAKKAFDSWRYAAPTDSSRHEVRAVLRFRRPQKAGAAPMPSGGGGTGGGGGGTGY
jgi:TonB family protein